MNDTAITTARALFPRGLHQPQDSYRFGAGALLLAALTLIFNDTVIPRITQEIESLFS